MVFNNEIINKKEVSIKNNSNSKNNTEQYFDIEADGGYIRNKYDIESDGGITRNYAILFKIMNEERIAIGY